MARNTQEAGPYARWAEMGLNNGLYWRQPTSCPLVLGAKVCYLGYQESSFLLGQEESIFKWIHAGGGLNISSFPQTIATLVSKRVENPQGGQVGPAWTLHAVAEPG